jgi:DNA-binding IclR family transcriptional regulator
MGAIPNPQQEGLMQRVGETRSPLHWTSWGEANIAHKPPRRRRITTARSTHSHPRRNPHSIE